MANDRSNPEPAAGTPATERAVLAAAVAEMRRGLAAGRPIDLVTLRAIAGATADAPRRHFPGSTNLVLTVLLDEVELLVGELALEHASLAAQLRAATRHRRAGTAYGSRSVG